MAEKHSYQTARKKSNYNLQTVTSKFVYLVLIQLLIYNPRCKSIKQNRKFSEA